MTPATRVPILTYHSLDGSGSVVSVAPERFREQMQGLAARGLLGIRLDTLLDAWEGRVALPERPVVITFDDGYANVLEHAAPVLCELGFGATLFVVTGACGGDNAWPGQDPAIPRLPLLSWRGLADWVAAGFELGAHSVSHARLPELDADALRHEVVDSRAALEQRLSVAVSCFAPPYGATNTAVADLVRRHYRAACGVRLAPARQDDDRHDLPRIDAYYLRRQAVFRALATPAGRAYLALRSAGRRLRARLSGP